MKYNNLSKLLKFNRKFFLIIGSFITITVMLFSCDEHEFLETKPVDFYAPENTYVTFADYESALFHLYASFRDQYYDGQQAYNFLSAKIQATDVAYIHKNYGQFSDYSSVLLPTNNRLVFGALWRPAYRSIYDANVIIERAASDNNELTESEKIKVIAEAKFFRGKHYKMLANIYGGVPIILNEPRSPIRDFKRATREETYQQAASDLKFAAENLGAIDEIPDEKVNNLAAYHVLSEVYVSLNRWQDAINAASVVINHPSTSLMTERFGRRQGWICPVHEYETNVYWDLFQQGNQNRSAGNREAIFVLQTAYDVPGGLSGGPFYEQVFSPRLWQANIQNIDGSGANLVPRPNVYTGGRAGGFTMHNYYFFGELWEKSGFDQDIRNAECNIVRDFLVRNPASDYNGQWVEKDNVPLSRESLNDTTRNYFKWITKVSTPGDQPSEFFIDGHEILGSVSYSHRAYRDLYVIRLAETHLLRAEAYLGAGNITAAAEDINIVRNRAEAPEIDPSEVDIDYILDERARELYIEESRVLTLGRLGKLVERTRKHNPLIGVNVQDHHDLWPIPQSEIEKNVEFPLEQNPGYN